jgi:nucleotide-binding universal stress UspA family protein
MTWKRHLLVVANVTATSDDLVRALTERADREPTRFTLVVPATRAGGGRPAATDQLTEALTLLSDAGLEVDGQVGHPDPIVAVTDAWDPRGYDEIVVSTLPMRFSKWLHAGLPERIARTTGAPVAHIVSEPPKPPAQTAPPPVHETPSGVMKPLSVLAWGGHKHH